MTTSPPNKTGRAFARPAVEVKNCFRPSRPVKGLRYWMRFAGKLADDAMHDPKAQRQLRTWIIRIQHGMGCRPNLAGGTRS